MQTVGKSEVSKPADIRSVGFVVADPSGHCTKVFVLTPSRLDNLMASGNL